MPAHIKAKIRILPKDMVTTLLPYFSQLFIAVVFGQGITTRFAKIPPKRDKNPAFTT
jgi:hypothetical protein